MIKNWKTYNLSEVFEIIGGGTPKTTISDYWNGSIPWLSVVDFNNDLRSVSKTEKSITESGLKNSSTKLLKKGQLIISARGTVGQIAQLEKDMAFNQSCYGLNGFENILINDYGYYLLKYSVTNIQANTHGSVFDTITRRTFENIEVCLPPLPEQKAIAQILSAIDDKIENNLAINKTLEEMAMALYKHWFVDFGPFQEGAFVESELGEIPKGLEVKKIGDFGTVVCGKTPSKKNEEYYSSYDYPFIKIPDMHGNTWVLNTTEGLSEEGNKSQNNKLLPSGSINVSCIATVGLVTLNIIPSHTNQQINSIVPFENFYRYYIYLSMLNMKQIFLNEASGGSATLNMNTSTFSRLLILKPNDKILQDFHLIIEKYFEQIKSNQIENQTLTQLRNTLLPKLISGEVRLKEFQEQTASVL